MNKTTRTALNNAAGRSAARGLHMSALHHFTGSQIQRISNFAHSATLKQVVKLIFTESQSALCMPSKGQL